MSIRFSSLIAAAFCLPVLVMAMPAKAQSVPSTCHAVASRLPHVQFASFQTAALEMDQVQITFAHHSTYVIESAGGVTIATDFSGYAGSGVVPRIVTMNKAHSTHFTPSPDPAIEMVLRGWGEDGGPARHAVTLDDVYIRNVTTDIRAYGGMEPDGNSIFIFEVAGLCIGHLGHLHHELTDDHFREIGRLDIVMVPVDGALTMSQGGMAAITTRLRSSIVLPMHRRGASVAQFLAHLGDGFAVDYRRENSMTVSERTLPRQPTVIVLSGI